MTIIIEDGTGLHNSNSYVTIEEAKTFAAARNVTLGDDADIEANLILSAEFIDISGPFKGVQLNDIQALEFPRSDRLYGESWGIPAKLKLAQCQLLLDIKESGALLTSSRQFAIKKEKLEGLETEYAVGANALYSAKAVHTRVDYLLSSFKKFSVTNGLIR